MPDRDVPDFVTHYYLPGASPFHNLSTLDVPALQVVLDGLEQRRRAGEHQRVFGSRYMDLRRRTEAKMLELFCEAGGRPERSTPHYFVLGDSEWYRGLAPGMQAVILTLDELASSPVSFTYPDSFTAMAVAGEFGLPYEPKPYHDRVFFLSELDDVIQRYGQPLDESPSDYTGYAYRPFEKYIEVQVWSDTPVRQYVGGG